MTEKAHAAQPVAGSDDFDTRARYRAWRAFVLGWATAQGQAPGNEAQEFLGWTDEEAIFERWWQAEIRVAGVAPQVHEERREAQAPQEVIEDAARTLGAQRRRRRWTEPLR